MVSEQLGLAFSRQLTGFRGDPCPDLAVRLERVERLRRMVIDNRDAFRAALIEDFGSHHPWLTDLMETGPVLGRCNYFLAHLPGWLREERIDLGPEHGSSHGEIVLLPKGVMGNIAPWNFAIESALVMCVDMLAAGNRVIIKPSELAPATAQAVADAVAAHFEPDLLTVVQGGPELAQEFAAMPWHHLTFTGSPRIGRLVAQAAARNLVPVTLELGGKNPALFAPDGVTEELVQLFLSFKTLKSGQVCTAPDYVLVPRAQLEEWVSLAKQVWRSAYPAYVGTDQCVGIINSAHYERLVGYVAEAAEKGVRCEGLNDDVPDPARWQLPLRLVIDPPADLSCMIDEVFGPIIPVVPYDTVDEAISRINAGETPLGAYIATHDTARAARFVREVRSGGAAVNNFGLQGGHVALPFGGLGNSGQGCHSAKQGFLNYSHAKSVFWGSGDNIVHKVLAPPLSELTGMAANGQYGEA
ncbi:aldehyde dehydrogenase family protein [Novosphingobium sp. B 225]|uniref:aldehyde dehydrogenase family protein n=1 Tax=Novosphingobium sp. B 225 TaxID=1961849 RepID=UPI000B4BA4A8|nr:aldehyde dehydrogenase family protein [Novosphingobium sp. B 225]